MMPYTAASRDRSVIDIGSNDGTLLKAFDKHRFWTYGIDPCATHDHAIREVFTASLAKRIADERKADIITANNVLANVDDLHDFMEGVRTLLAPDGIFVCETGSGPDLIALRLYDCIYHEHLSYFGLNQLAQLFHQHGLVIMGAVHTESKGGCLRVTARHAAAPGFALCSYPEQQLEPTHADLAWFRRGLEQTRTDVAKWMNDHPLMMPIGYGASVGVTTLRYAFGLEREFFIFLDDNQNRQGLFVPGGCVGVNGFVRLTGKVYAPADLAQLHPGNTVIVLFAWRYADVILAKHQAFLAAGGVILQPLPTFTVHTGESYGRRTGNARPAERTPLA